MYTFMISVVCGDAEMIAVQTQGAPKAKSTLIAKLGGKLTTQRQCDSVKEQNQVNLKHSAVSHVFCSPGMTSGHKPARWNLKRSADWPGTI